MLLGYAARNAVNPHAQPGHVADFQKLAMKQGQDLGKAVPGYPGIAGQIAGRIEGLDPARRAAAHADLNTNLLQHVSNALTSGQTAPAIAQIGPHIHRLAQQYGVPTAQPGVPPLARMAAMGRADRGAGGPMGSAPAQV